MKMRHFRGTKEQEEHSRKKEGWKQANAIEKIQKERKIKTKK